MLLSFPDIDECRSNTDGCAQFCTNTIGSYICSCRSGFALASDRHACESTNEGQKRSVKDGNGNRMEIGNGRQIIWIRIITFLSR